jgi:hypothetical protein
MVAVFKKKARACNTLAQRPAFWLFFGLCLIITLAYLYSDSDIPLSSTSDFLVDNAIDKSQPLPPRNIIKQSALPLSSTSDLISDNADKEDLPLPLHDIVKQRALRLSTTSDLLAYNAVEENLPLAPNFTTKNTKRAQNCPQEIDGLRFVRRRAEKTFDFVKQRPKTKAEAGHVLWQQTFLEDKWGFYVFCKANGIRVPEIYMCSTDGPESLKDWIEPAGLGFVVKIKDGSGSKGVYLMESGFGGREQISGRNLTREMIIQKLRKVYIVANRDRKVKNVHAEELVKSSTAGMPTPDYKIHVANGEILYIAVIHNRGTDLECAAIFNERFDRVDGHGCFSWIRKYKPPRPGKCSVSTTDAPVADYSQCGDFARPKEWDKLVAMAKKMSRIIGIYVRIDMYIHAGEIVMGEATFLPTLGKYHCFAELDENGCIDPCLLGRFLKRQNDVFNNTEGGPLTPQPVSFKGWEELSTKDKCERVMGASSSRSLPSTN